MEYTRKGGDFLYFQVEIDQDQIYLVLGSIFRFYGRQIYGFLLKYQLG